MPTTVWIWSLKLLRPYAVLVHLNPVKSIQWHPTIPDLLLILCANDSENSSSRTQGVAYLWSAKWSKPKAITVPLEKPSGNFWARWLFTPSPSNLTTASNGTSGSSSSGSLVSDRRSKSPEKECDRKPTLICGDRDGFTVGIVEGEEINQDQEMRDLQEEDAGYGCMGDNKRLWNPRDWAFFSPSQPQTSTSTAQASSIGRSIKSGDSSTRKPKEKGEEDHRLSGGRHHISVGS